MTLRRASSLVFAAALACWACGGDDEPTPTSADPEACEAWRAAYCDQADRCNARELTACVAELSGIPCAPEASLSHCTSELERTDRCGVPPGCDLDVVSDRAEVSAVCEDFSTQTCDAFVRCGRQPDATTCKSWLVSQFGIECTRAVGWTADLARCEDALATLECDDAFPATCATVITFLAK